MDRLPSAKSLDDEPPPPISNSLMAAIKRSQANQRRHPETFHLYQQAQNQFSLSSVKVELKHFILSILDDPIVSRVFGEAGFQSTDIKLAILHPPPPISRFNKNRYPPPLFLCNLPDSDPKGYGFNFPFVVENGDENCRRIGKVLVKKKVKNPLLIGFCAKEALDGFTDIVEKGKGGGLPAEIDGVSVNCVGTEISEFVSNDGSEEMMGLKFKVLGDVVEKCTGCGIVVNFGELDVLVNGSSVDAVKYVVSRLSDLINVHGEKLWLIGSAGSYETYLKFLARFPSIEKDWDLHLLPITTSTSPNGGSYSKSSLMGSFVPFGGFFPTPSEFKNLLSSENKSISRCDLCNEKYDQEASVILKGGSTISVADQHLPSLSSWLQKDETDTCNSAVPAEARDGGVLNARLMGLERKWNDICQRLHHQQSLQQDKSHIGSPVPGVGSFCSNANRTESNGKGYIPNESTCTDLSSCMPLNLPTVSPQRQNIEIQVTSKAEIPSFQQNVSVEISKIQQLEMKKRSYPSYPFCCLRPHSDITSCSSVTSVTTDLGLGTLYASSEQENRSPKFQDSKNHLLKVSGPVSSDIDGVSKNPSANHIAQTSSYSSPKVGGQMNEIDFKYLWRVLADKVSWQDEAICAISETVSSCRNGHGRLRGQTHKGDIWLSFLGPDKVGKRRIASALAEIIRGDLLSVDLNPVNFFTPSDSIFDSQCLNSCSVKFRGKTIVGDIAEKLSRKPHSVVLLENIDKADFPTQHSLTQAIKTCRFPDSNGREVSINNVIFVTTSSNDSTLLSVEGTPKFSEERILEAKGLQMKIVVESVAGDMTRTKGSNVLLMPMKETSVNKRKAIDSKNSLAIPKRVQKVSRTCIDLNLPVEEMEDGNDYGICESDSSSEPSDGWLEDFLDQVDQKVAFKPFNFDALAEKILKEIEKSFRKTVGSDILLEIDQEVMVQILAAAWLSSNNRAVEEWVQQIVQRSFVEAQQKHHLTSQSIVKLVALEGLLVEEQAANVYLPANISVN